MFGLSNVTDVLLLIDLFCLLVFTYMPKTASEQVSTGPCPIPNRKTTAFSNPM